MSVSIPGELARHARERAREALRLSGQPRTPKELEDLLMSLFVAGWLDWAIHAPRYVHPDVKGRAE